MARVRITSYLLDYYANTPPQSKSTNQRELAGRLDCTHAKDTDPWVILDIFGERSECTSGARRNRGGEGVGDKFVNIWCMIREKANK